MKNHNAILNQIDENTKKIEAAENKIIKLSFIEESRAAAENKDFDTVKALREKAKANEKKQLALSETAYRLKIENKLLKDNAIAATAAEAVPVIREAFKKYEGKSYGEKTKAAIYNEVKKAGFSFYVCSDGRTMEVHPLTADGFTDYRTKAARIHANYNTPFIDDKNKIRVQAAEIRTNEKYTENTEARAEEIIEAFRAHEEATKAAKETERKLNSILPESLNSINNINDYIYLNV